MTINVRPMTEQDVPAAATAQSEAFGWNPESMIQRYADNPSYTWRDGWVVEEDGEIGAAALAVPTTWWFDGASYAVSAIRAVGVRPVARRRGYASQMMRGIVRADHEAARPFSLLFPFQHGYYRRLGYATVGLTHFYRVPVSRIHDHAEQRRRVRAAREADHEAIYDLHRRSLLAGEGGLERNARQWTARWAKSDESWVIYDHDGPQGYLAYQTIENEISVRELIAPTPDAERGLWAFLAAQIEQHTAVTYHAPANKPLWTIFREPLMHEAANRGFVLNDIAALTAGLMARLVDVPAAFACRTFPVELAGSLVLDLRDPVLEANTGTFQIRFESGRAEVTPTTDAATASCDIVTLSQLFCGVLRASDARWYGQLTADDATIALLERAFGNVTPFIHPADYF
ncbi:MAG TPA: GNAT family N-acetyltransferase [Herpetosiphonaceae bacterium]